MKKIYSKDAGRDHMKEAIESYDSLRDVRNILPLICAAFWAFQTWFLEVLQSQTWSFMTRGERKILIISSKKILGKNSDWLTLMHIPIPKPIPLTPTKANYK